MTTHVYEVMAHNYAQDSDNKVHDDAVAARYGFRGGLVPGAADFAYLAQAVYRAWGDDWLHGGAMQAKFIKPVYHGELARAEARETGDPERLELALVDPRGQICAVGQARLKHAGPAPALAGFPHHVLPRSTDLPPPTVEAFAAGRLLASYDFVHETAACERETRELFVEPITAADGSHPWHPALCTHLGNQIVLGNVRLGPWVHTASDVRYHDAPRDGDAVSLRGRVANTFEKRGHVMTECDVLIVANDERPLVTMRHTAIIRLAGDG